MKSEYDLSEMKSRKNPYEEKLKKAVTLRLGENVNGYFKKLTDETEASYQILIGLFLRDCVVQHMKIDFFGRRNSAFVSGV